MLCLCICSQVHALVGVQVGIKPGGAHWRHHLQRKAALGHPVRRDPSGAINHSQPQRHGYQPLLLLAAIRGAICEALSGCPATHRWLAVVGHKVACWRLAFLDRWLARGVVRGVVKGVGACGGRDGGAMCVLVTSQVDRSVQPLWRSDGFNTCPCFRGCACKDMAGRPHPQQGDSIAVIRRGDGARQPGWQTHELALLHQQRRSKTAGLSGLAVGLDLHLPAGAPCGRLQIARPIPQGPSRPAGPHPRKGPTVDPARCGRPRPSCPSRGRHGRAAGGACTARAAGRRRLSGTAAPAAERCHTAGCTA